MMEGRVIGGPGLDIIEWWRPTLEGSSTVSTWGKQPLLKHSLVPLPLLEGFYLAMASICSPLIVLRK